MATALGAFLCIVEEIIRMPCIMLEAEHWSAKRPCYAHNSLFNSERGIRNIFGPSQGPYVWPVPCTHL